MLMQLESASAGIEGIGSMIFLVRGQRVMLDSDLAQIYGVTTRRLNEQFRRNKDRFPNDFAFQLSAHESASMRSQNATASRRNVRHLPFVFTEHGAIMLASILKSQRAIEMSIFVVRAFVEMREVLTSNRHLAAKLEELEKRVGGHDEAISSLVAAIREMLNPSSAESAREIGFHMREEAPPYRTPRKR